MDAWSLPCPQHPPDEVDLGLDSVTEMLVSPPKWCWYVARIENPEIVVLG